jgi:hypothetical protein
VQTTPPNLKSRQSLLLGSLKFDNVQYRPASVNKSHSSALGFKLPQGLLPNLPTSPSKHHTLQATTTLTASKAPSNSRRWVYYIAKSSPAQGRYRRALLSRVSSNIRRGSLGRNSISGSAPFISAQQKGPHPRPCSHQIIQREPQAAHGHE